MKLILINYTTRRKLDSNLKDKIGLEYRSVYTLKFEKSPFVSYIWTIVPVYELYADVFIEEPKNTFS